MRKLIQAVPSTQSRGEGVYSADFERVPMTLADEKAAFRARYKDDYDRIERTSEIVLP